MGVAYDCLGCLGVAWVDGAVGVTCDWLPGRGVDVTPQWACPWAGPTFGPRAQARGPPLQEAVCQQRLLGVLVLRAAGQGAEQLGVVGRAAVVEHVRQLQRLRVAPLPEHLRDGHPVTPPLPRPPTIRLTPQCSGLPPGSVLRTMEPCEFLYPKNRSVLIDQTHSKGFAAGLSKICFKRTCWRENQVFGPA